LIMFLQTNQADHHRIPNTNPINHLTGYPSSL